MNFTFSKINLASRFSARERKVLGLGAAAAAIFCVLYFLVLPAYDTAKQYPDQIAQRVKLLRKYKEVIAQREIQEQSLDETKKRLAALESHLLSARTTATAQAELQGLVNDLAKQSQLQVSRSDFLPKKEISKDYERVMVRLDTTGNINQITAFLSAAKSIPNLVLNDDLRIVNYSGTSDEFKKTKHVAATIVISGVMRHE